MKAIHPTAFWAMLGAASLLGGDFAAAVDFGQAHPSYQ